MREYYLPIGGKEEKVCKMFFKKLFSVSDGRITRLLKPKHVGGTPPQDRRGKHSGNRTNNTRINKVKDFINKFPSYESHYSRMKNLNRKYLSKNLNLKIIYNLYKNEVSEPVFYYVFKDVLNKQFNLHFHAPISDSCKKCDSFNIKLKFLTNDKLKTYPWKRSNNNFYEFFFIYTTVSFLTVLQYIQLLSFYNILSIYNYGQVRFKF